VIVASLVISGFAIAVSLSSLLRLRRIVRLRKEPTLASRNLRAADYVPGHAWYWDDGRLVSLPFKDGTPS
jgi:hypothetical protein